MQRTSTEDIAARIRDFPLDFTEKLARENGWSRPYAERVVKEYRRFAFIAAVADHPVSPSDAVDQAWHLHLLDTRSYWEEFCPLVLGKRLHHKAGGDGDRARLAADYERTLQSYRRWFGDAAEDVWPSPAAARTNQPRPRRIDLRRHLPLPRVLLHGAAALIAVGAAGAFLQAVARGMIGAAATFSAPGFLLAFLGGLTANVLLGIWLRRRARAASPVDASVPGAPALDPYEIAMLADGARRAAHVAVTELYQQGALVVVPGDTAQARLKENGPWPAITTPFQRAVLLGVSARPQAGVERQLPTRGATVAACQARLEADGLLIPRWRRWLARSLPLVGSVALLWWTCVSMHGSATPGVLGGWLALLVVLPGLVPLALNCVPLWRTTAGDGVLARLGAGLKVPAGDLPRVVALSGAAALRGGPLNDLANVLAPLPPPTECGGGGCGGCGG